MREKDASNNPEGAIREFMKSALKLPIETVNKVAFHRVHRLGARNDKTKGPRPIMAKFEHYQQKELIKSRGRELKGTIFGLNYQFPKEMNVVRDCIRHQDNKGWMVGVPLSLWTNSL
jgi:hypothetical protein